jgi:hypothetical protein
MNGFILGFQRFVWCPKWTPESNNSFTPMLITIFPLVEPRETVCFRAASRGTRDCHLMLLWSAATHTGEAGRIDSMRKRPFSLNLYGQGNVKNNRKAPRGNRFFGRFGRACIRLPDGALSSTKAICLKIIGACQFV